VSTVLVYSDDPAIRAQIRTALGRTPSPEVGRVEYVECADGPAVIATVDAGGIDVAILDGEAWPTGGMGLARQFKDEVLDPPATVLLVGRRDDTWLAKWSRAEAVLSLPIDPFALTEAVVSLLLARAAGAARAGQPSVVGERPRFGLR
jgi:CheY-like chemotaxis protein